MLETKKWFEVNCIGCFHCYAIKDIKKLIASRETTAVQVKGSNICVPS